MPERAGRVMVARATVRVAHGRRPRPRPAARPIIHARTEKCSGVRCGLVQRRVLHGQVLHATCAHDGVEGLPGRATAPAPLQQGTAGRTCGLKRHRRPGIRRTPRPRQVHTLQRQAIHLLRIQRLRTRSAASAQHSGRVSRQLRLALRLGRAGCAHRSCDARTTEQGRQRGTASVRHRRQASAPLPPMSPTRSVVPASRAQAARAACRACLSCPRQPAARSHCGVARQRAARIALFSVFANQGHATLSRLWLRNLLFNRGLCSPCCRPAAVGRWPCCSRKRMGICERHTGRSPAARGQSATCRCATLRWPCARMSRTAHPARPAWRRGRGGCATGCTPCWAAIRPCNPCAWRATAWVRPHAHVPRLSR